MHKVFISTAITAASLFPGASLAASGDQTPFAVPPYLQFHTPDSAAIYWETKLPTASVLEYGKDNNVSRRLADPTVTKNHRILLPDLQPATLYNYRIVTTVGENESFSETYPFDTTFNYTHAPLSPDPSPYPDDARARHYAQIAQRILARTATTNGYCLVYGSRYGQLAYELAKQSNLIIVGVDEDPSAVAAARKKLMQAGAYGSRITLRHVPSLNKLPITKYFANLIVSDRLLSENECPGLAAEMFRVLRPSGGVAYLGQPSGVEQPLTRGRLNAWLGATPAPLPVEYDTDGLWVKIVRGQVPGAGWWSHQYGTEHNNGNSYDHLEGAANSNDMQIQWIGRPGANFGIDRQVRMPAPVAKNGKLYHQGLNRIVAMDSYNGLILWSLEIPHLRRVNLPRDAGNACADDDYLYLAVQDTCWRLDGNTGARTLTHRLPEHASPADYDWGCLFRTSDKLYGSTVRKGAVFTEYWGGQAWYDATSGPLTFKICSDSLFADNLKTGEKVWTYKNGVILNSTVALADGKVFFVESRHPTVKALTTGRIGNAELWSDQYLVALHADSGHTLWERPLDTADGIVVFYMMYADRTLLIGSSDTGYHLYAYDAGNGETKWQTEHPWDSSHHGGHMQRPIVVSNMVYYSPYGYDLRTGARMVEGIPRGTCGSISASQTALFYRPHSNIAMWDTGRATYSDWFGIRPSCWINVIPAGGMVLAPEGGAGCSCGHWFETSVGFVAKDAQITD